MTNKTYTIIEIGDLCNVPDDRLDDLLHELSNAIKHFKKQSLKFSNTLDLIVNENTKIPDEVYQYQPKITKFIWVDDGKITKYE